MGLLDFLKGTPKPPEEPFFLPDGTPRIAAQRLEQTRQGRLPWVSTLTTPELLLAKSHGVEMLGPVASTCWMHYGYSWTQGHAQGWHTALERLQKEAAAMGANAVIDVQMKTVELDIENSMDFSLVGTAVKFSGLPPSPHPVVSTVPALEFVQLLEAGIIPVGLAVGAQYDWTPDGCGAQYKVASTSSARARNFPMTNLMDFWEKVRRDAHQQLRYNTAAQGGDGVLAQVQWSQLFERDREDINFVRYLGRHIVIGTVVVLTDKKATIPHPIELVLDCNDFDLFGRTSPHHNTYSDGV